MAAKTLYIDPSLVVRAKEGDSAALEALCLASRRIAFLIGFKVFRNREDAEDIAQQACLKVTRYLSTFRGESQFSVWLYRIALNLSKAEQRRRGTEPHHVSLYGKIEGEQEEKLMEISSKDLRLERAVDRIMLSRAIENLSPKYRNAIVLHYFDGLKDEEIVKMNGGSLSTQRSLRQRAKVQLRDFFSGSIPKSRCGGGKD